MSRSLFCSASLTLSFVLVASPAFAQKGKQQQVSVQKTSMSRDQEIQVGKEAAAQVEREMEVIKNAEAEAWLSRAAAKGFKEAKRLLPQAQAAKQNAHARYQAIEDERKSWNRWYVSAPYYLVWGSSGWYYR